MPSSKDKLPPAGTEPAIWATKFPDGQIDIFTLDPNKHVAGSKMARSADCFTVGAAKLKGYSLVRVRIVEVMS